ncbi:hypothetical protein Ancab_017304 [Ancistrocladus abbreviatus]
MSTEPSGSIVEHLVLFNINDDEDPTNVNNLVNGLVSLNSLDQVLYLTAGPILRIRSSPLKLTHLIHARYRSKEDLSSYTTHPAHVKVAVELALPICVDNIVSDWAVDSLDGPVVPHPNRAMRVTFFKFKEGMEEKKDEILEELGKIKKSLGVFEQVSFGGNFNIERGKGYGLGSLVIFPDLNELDACEEYEDAMRKTIERFKASLDGYIAVDYVVPRPQSTVL